MTDTFINLTPHAITIPDCPRPDGDGTAPWTLPPSGKIARAREQINRGAPIADIPTSYVHYFGTIDLPDPQPGVYLVVSSLTAEAAYHAGRKYADLLVPGDPVRDAAGKIAGCRSLARWLPSRSHIAYLDALDFNARDHAQVSSGATSIPIKPEHLTAVAVAAEQMLMGLALPGFFQRELRFSMDAWLQLGLDAMGRAYLEQLETTNRLVQQQITERNGGTDAPGGAA